VDTARTAYSGYQLSRILKDEYDIIAEMADESHVVFIVTPADTWDDLVALKKALKGLDKKAAPCSGKTDFFPYNDPPSPCEIPNLSDYLGKAAFVPLERSVGFVSASMVTPYPPGIPVLCPGETITESILAQVQRLMCYGCELQGLEDNMEMIRVLEKET
jgi:arginine/lysine/ornithine decarboxylase